MLQGEWVEQRNKGAKTADATRGRGPCGVAGANRRAAKDYATAKKEISAALTPMEFVSLDDFHRRKLQPGEACRCSYTT